MRFVQHMHTNPNRQIGLLAGKLARAQFKRCPVKQGPWLPAIGVLIAIGITTAMDASGLSMFSALALLPLLILFWYLERLARAEVGFIWGRPL